MLIYFLRHADAEDMRTSDFARVLTPKGREQSEKVGKFCARNGLAPEVILSSPVVRADQTAKIVAKALGDAAVVTESWLACGMTPDVCLDELKGFAKCNGVMLVGHEPDFSGAVSALIGLRDSDSMNIRKASLTAVDLDGFNAGAGRLQFSVPARLM